MDDTILNCTSYSTRGIDSQGKTEGDKLTIELGNDAILLNATHGQKLSPTHQQQNIYR